MIARQALFVVGEVVQVVVVEGGEVALVAEEERGGRGKTHSGRLGYGARGCSYHRHASARQSKGRCGKSTGRRRSGHISGSDVCESGTRRNGDKRRTWWPRSPSSTNFVEEKKERKGVKRKEDEMKMKMKTNCGGVQCALVGTGLAGVERAGLAEEEEEEEGNEKSNANVVVGENDPEGVGVGSALRSCEVRSGDREGVWEAEPLKVDECLRPRGGRMGVSIRETDLDLSRTSEGGGEELSVLESETWERASAKASWFASSSCSWS